MVGLALLIDAVITLFTGWEALSFWFAPLSNSLFTFHGLLLFTSPGFYIAGALVLVLWIREGPKVMR